MAGLGAQPGVLSARPRRLAARPLLGLFAGALAVRVAFVLWAPGEASGDALWHHLRAVGLARGVGYVNMNGSPSIAWMPGWSLLLAALYWSFGEQLLLGLLANALLGAATAAMVAALGARLLSAEAGLAAGIVYALWPGNVYYAATPMSETLFNFTLVGTLLLLVQGLSPGCARPGRRIFAAGLAFGAACMTKAEPLVLLPVLLLALHLGLPAGGRRLRHAALLVAATALVMAPWVVRNYVHFDRLVVTTRTGAANAWLGNHAGASGGQSLAAAIRQKRHLRMHPEESGYRLAWEFAVSHPREEAAILWRKLVLTYGSDDDAVVLIRGVFPRERHIDLLTERRLRRIANGFWWAVLALAAVGLCGVRRWSGLARTVVLGVPAAWLCVHLVFIGGARFHVPETPSIALAAGAGVLRLRDAFRRARGGSEEG